MPTDATDVLNLALQDAPEIGHEYGYGDLAADLVAALRAEGYVITREAATHHPRCYSHTEPGACDCGILAMIDAPASLREWVQDTYDEHGQFLWWRQYGTADEAKRSQMRTIAAVDGMGG